MSCTGSDDHARRDRAAGDALPTQDTTEPQLLLYLQVLAFYPVADWVARCVHAGGDRAWGLIALATAGVFLWLHPADDGDATDEPAADLSLPWAVFFSYLLGCFFLPLAALGALASLCAALTASVLWLRTRLHVGLLALLLLGLPLLPEWQAALGYSLRWLMGVLAAPLLQLAGIDVLRVDTTLYWQNHVVRIDVACSGVRKLWTGLYLASALACFLDLGAGRIAALLAAAVPCVLAANVLRVLALFLLETRIPDYPPWWHDAVGAATFAVAAGLIAVAARAVADRRARAGGSTTPLGAVPEVQGWFSG